VHTTNGAIEAVWRIESARLIAGLTRIVRDVGLAEDLAQDALVAALEQWPRDGIPDNPGAWLMATARHRAVDQIRRKAVLQRKHQQLATEARIELESEMADLDEGADDYVGDDLLRLVFICCHPVLSRDARVTLTLRLLGGLTTDEIARAFVTPVTTIQQRVVRAKRTLSEAKVPFELPPQSELVDRLGSVLEVVYLIFNEGYSATAGDDWLRPELCNDALRLGRVLQGLLPDEPEVHGLAALMELQASRLHARVASDGSPILLTDQNRARWDRVLIGRGLAALARAEQLRTPLGPYALQAAIAACHARARTAGDTDWEQIAALYDALAQINPSPIVELNRAVAISMAYGPAEALVIVDRLVADGRLESYHLLPAVRADLLAKLGRRSEAHAELVRAAGLTRNEQERSLLRTRAAALEAELPGGFVAN
jgi:RNA polymerase sigma factor (sigma-70 family)